MKRILLFLLLITCSVLSVFSQSTIKGIIKDQETGELLIGTTVMLENTQLGAIVDLDGLYEIKNVPNGSYTLNVNYVGYAAQKLPIKVDGADIEMNLALKSDAQVLEGVMIVGKADRNTVSAMTKLQQKSPAMLTGITSQEIQKSPDRNTSDVLKRVSGTTVQDNKFVVIRGLSDRYNTALINGQSLPSSEPDKRAFSFDLFPASLMSNLVIFKTANPDLPGEFAGGVIELNTKEVPDEPFFQVSVGSIYNSIATFKPNSFYKGSNTDWLGYDHSYRTLPSSITKENLTGPDKFETSKLISNDWGITDYSSLAPSYNVQLSGGTSKEVFGRNLGMIAALSYSNNNKFTSFERADFNIDKTQLYSYTDNNFKKESALGGLLNFAYKLSDNSKLSFNNIISLKGEDNLLERTGKELEATRDMKGYAFLYQSTMLVSSQLKGEHSLSGNGMKLKWGISANDIKRSTPSYRRLSYYKNFDAEVEDPYYAFIPVGAPSPNYAGRFYSDQSERMYAANTDLTIPYLLKSTSNSLKFGVFAEKRSREFDARVFGYTIASISKFDQKIYSLPIGDIFDLVNIGERGLILKESTNPNDSYDAGSTLTGGFVMFDQAFTSKLKLVGGVRIENYRQNLESVKYGGQPIELDVTTLDVLPSANLIYNLSEKTNLRLSASQTVTRPNFRELAPFSFYDYATSANNVGNPDLVRTKITNLDAKYEFFPGGSQNISVSTFYKHFVNPIEQFYESSGAGTRNFNFKNAKSAMNLGAELEFRFKLERAASILSNFTIFGNVSYISSKVDVSVDAASATNGIERALQGQSPYILNGGINYTSKNGIVGFTVLYNKIGRRIWLVGSNQYLDTYEAPRDVLDLQFTMKLFKNGELKLNVQDVLANSAIFYQDQNNSGHYDEEDTKIVGTNIGTNIGLAFTYKF